MRGSQAAHYGARCGAHHGTHRGTHRAFPPFIRVFISIFLLCCTLCANAVQAQRLPDFLKTVSIADLFPGADRVGPPEGKPMTARAYAGERALGRIYLTSDVVNTRGYSSKPIDVLVALADNGRIVAYTEQYVCISLRTV